MPPRAACVMIARCPCSSGLYVCFFSVSLTAPALTAQTATTVPAGTLLAMENSKAVSGVRIQTQPDGTVWFLVPSNDRIVQLQSDGVTMKQWQIREDKDIGANPVDFKIDGNIVWFIENGESLIDAGHSVFGRLDTTTGQLREWIVPGSAPGRLLSRARRQGVAPPDQRPAPVRGPDDARRRGLPLDEDLRLQRHGGRARTARSG